MGEKTPFAYVLAAKLTLLTGEPAGGEERPSVLFFSSGRGTCSMDPRAFDSGWRTGWRLGAKFGHEGLPHPLVGNLWPLVFVFERGVSLPHLPGPDEPTARR